MRNGLGPLVVLGNLLADLVVRVEARDGAPGRCQLGGGGSANVAIAAARLGLHVVALGEIADDVYGDVVLTSLARSRIETSAVHISSGGRTPIACVLVAEDGQPSFWGCRGEPRLEKLPAEWTTQLRAARAIHVSGFVESFAGAALLLAGMREARDAGVPVFFDIGPGNELLDNGWHAQAVRLATVVLANEPEALRATGAADALAAGGALLAAGPALALITLGAAGCLLVTREGPAKVPGYQVPVVDVTGAGDTFAAAAIFGYLKGLPLRALGALANAAGAAKVQQPGTGLNVATRTAVRAVLERFGEDTGLLD